MRRHEIWLALGAFSLTGVVFAYVVQHQARLEYAPEVVVVIVAVLGLGISCLTFLVLLKR
jgi:hypothetical protein